MGPVVTVHYSGGLLLMEENVSETIATIDKRSRRTEHVNIVLTTKHH